MSKFFFKFGIPTVVLSLITSLLSSLDTTPASATMPTPAIDQLTLEGGVLDITRELTFSAVIRCTVNEREPIASLELRETEDRVEPIVIVNTSISPSGTNEFRVTWTVSPDVSIDLAAAAQIAAKAVTYGCEGSSLYESSTLLLDGPLTEIRPNPVARRWSNLYDPLDFTVHTFQDNQRVIRDWTDIYLESPICGFDLFDPELGYSRFVSLNEYDEFVSENGDEEIVTGHNSTICDGGTLKAEEQWRQYSIFMQGGTLVLIDDWQIPLAPTHFSDRYGNEDFIDAWVSGLLPVGDADAAYVFKRHAQFDTTLDWWEREFSLGALLNTNGVDGRSLSADDCSSNALSAITSSSTERLVLAAGIAGQSLEPELLKMTFDDNTVSCERASVFVSDFWDYNNDFIRSIALLDSRTAVTLSGGSLISIIDIDDSHDGTWSEWHQYTVASNPSLQKIVGDGMGGLWGVSQTSSSVQIYEIVLPPIRIIRPSDPQPEFSFASFNTFQDDSGADEDSDDQLYDDDQPFYQSITPHLIGSFDLDEDLGEEIVDFQLRGDILTVTTNADPYWWTRFTQLWSFDKSRTDANGRYAVVAGMNSVLPRVLPDENIECSEQLYVEPIAFCYLSLLGVDSANGVSVLSAERSNIVRSGPAPSEHTTRFFDDAHDVLIGGGGAEGTLSNASNGVWLFSPWDPMFERLVLPTISAPLTPETPFEPEVTSPPAQELSPPAQMPVPPIMQAPIPLPPNPGQESTLRPALDSIQLTGMIGSDLVLTGQNLSSVTGLRIGGVPQVITSANDRSLRFTVSAGTRLGSNDIVLVSSFGTLTLQSAIQIESPSASVATATKSALIGKTRMLSKNSAVNQSWFAGNLKDSGLTRIACTVLVSPNATHHQRVQARKQASRVCAQAAGHLEAATVWFQTRETTRSRMPGRALITFRG